MQQGLPANAYRNAKTYADTSFPATAVAGDRIYRTDINGGTWYNYTGTAWVAGSAAIGTAFPTNPANGQRFYRADISGGRWYMYNGSSWDPEPILKAQSSYPSSPTFGDRIFRTDLGYWFTRITISGTDYWCPDTGSLVAAVTQGSGSQSIAATTITQITGMNNNIKNTLGWWSGNLFTPQVPGYYLVSGTVGGQSIGSSPNTTNRHAWINKNTTTAMYDAYRSVPGTVTNSLPTQGSPHSQATAPMTVYMNGSSDYLCLMTRSNAAFTTTTPGTVGNTSAFFAQFVGPTLL